MVIFISGWNCIEDFWVPELAFIVQMCSSEQTFSWSGYRPSPVHGAQFEGWYNWCASSWIDWMFQHKNQHSSLYLQDLNLESSPLLLSCPLLYSVFVVLFGFLWDFTVYKMSQYFTGVLVLYNSHSINVTVQTLPISAEAGYVLVWWLWPYHIGGSCNVS